MSRGKWKPNVQFRSAHVGTSQSKDKFVNAEVIDLDSGDVDVDVDVVIIDESGSSNQRVKFARKEATSSPNCVISIDDDDDDDDSGTDSHTETSGSQCGPGNRYGLETGTSGSKDSSGVGLSDGEGSDCEILDDSSGNIRREWERAHSRKTTPPDKFESAPSDNVKRRSDKPFADAFNDSFGESSSSRKKVGVNEDGAASSVPNADSSENLFKEKASAKRQPWYEKEYGSFVPGMHQQEINERVPPFFSIRHCSYSKGKSVFSDKGVRAPEKMVVEEEAAKEADNVVGSSKKSAEDEIAEETNDKGVRTPEKVVVGEEAAKQADNVVGSSKKPAEDEIAEETDDSRTSETVKEALLDITNGISEAKTGPDHDACLVGEREKHKESEEYKRAAEEEWASRQKQLQLQSEEAQKLKKRKKAQTLRLLDMERRQKQRLEEMRQNEKKIEETLNLKEQFRSEVMKDLERIERRHTDMASILRALDINVDGGLFPSPNQVKSAFKQAKFKFHPDRVKTSDARQQVKAEETFKFIIRLKEKLLPAA